MAIPCLSARPILELHEEHLLASSGRLMKHSGQRLTRRSIFSAFASIFSFFLRPTETFHMGLSEITLLCDFRQSGFGMTLKIAGFLDLTAVS